jgi:hypothetical protein
MTMKAGRLGTLTAAAMIVWPVFLLAATPVSYIDLSTAKEIMMVDGKPFLYTAAQISTFRLIEDHHFTWADIEPVFRAAADTGFTTVGVPVLWKNVETSENEYDWSSIEIPIDYAAKHGLKIEIIYPGSDFCGGYPIPDRVAQSAERILQSDGTVARSNGMDKLDKADPGLQRSERNFLTKLLNHVRAYTEAKGYPHIVIGVQLLNESTAAVFFEGVSLTDRSYSASANGKWSAGRYSSAAAFNTDVLWEYLEGLAQAVKASDYPVWTRTNFACGWEKLCESVIAKNEAVRIASGTALDFIGNDPYIQSPGAIYSYCTAGAVAHGRNLPMVMENSGNYANTAQLLFAAFAGDCRYHVWEMNSSIKSVDFGTDMGLYSTNWSRRTIAPKSHVSGLKKMLRMLNKDRLDLATLRPGSAALKFFNAPSADGADQSETVNGTPIRFVTSDEGGAAVAARSGMFVFLSAVGGKFHLPTSMNIASLEAGYFDAADVWVAQRPVSFKTSRKDTSFTIRASEAIRLIPDRNARSEAINASAAPNDAASFGAESAVGVSSARRRPATSRAHRGHTGRRGDPTTKRSKSEVQAR